MTPGAFAEYRGTALWSAIENTLAELIATHEVSINTSPEYVIGYLCRELVAKKMIDGALRLRSERRSKDEG